MVAAGRFVCVALPFVLTLASLVCILITLLAGVGSNHLNVFEIDTKDLSIAPSDLHRFEGTITKRLIHESTTAALSGLSASNSAGNITAADLSLADSYKVSLWNFCSTYGTNTFCSDPKFNFAASELNVPNNILVTLTGLNVTLPNNIRDSLKTFTTVSKWTQVVYIIAAVTAVLELAVGIFAFCSRAGSCVTFIMSGISTSAVVAASILATGEGAVVVAAIKTSTEVYGVKASLNATFLAITWLGAAFSIAGGLFWLFSVCCCANDHHNRTRGGPDSEKLLPTKAYQRVEDPNDFNANTEYGPRAHSGYNSEPSRERTGAYEAYSYTGPEH
jgi:hypothetical protein